MNNTLPEPAARPPQLSLAPGFSRVSQSQSRGNRFNGFPPPAPEAVETALLPARLNTRLKPGASGKSAKRHCCGLQSFAFALLAAALLCAPHAFAQVKSEPVPVKPAVPVPPVPPAPPKLPPPLTAPGTVSTPATPAPRKLPEVYFDGLPLREAILILHSLLKEAKLEPMNILLAPGTQDLFVPEMKVHNVSGADALQLIAAAAECTVEPMISTESQAVLAGHSPAGNAVFSYPQRVIGYTFRAKPKSSTILASPGISMAVGSKANAGFASVGAANGRLTRIYPLGAVSTATKFPDLEKTLREIFKADGVVEHQVSLALHEKTNVLVVNAAEPVHALVEQFLVALKDNTNQADRLNTARDRAMGREELESAVRAQKRLAEELAERDGLLRELQKELRKLQDAVQKPPSAK